MIDADGFRPNVGIILTHLDSRVLWARRLGQDAWQFPQGGICPNETPEEAMFRELREEIGLVAQDVQIIGRTKGWLRYRLPKHLVRHNNQPLCIGQKQVWFLLRLMGDEAQVRLDMGEKPEFDEWRWVPYWRPLQEVVSFKRRVYERALYEFAPLLSLTHRPPRRRGSLARRRRLG